MNDGGQKPGRPARLHDSATRHLERLRANKAQLDLHKRERERREDSALAALVAACARAEHLVRERDRQLAELTERAEQPLATARRAGQPNSTPDGVLVNGSGRD
ncbi:MAG TPA: hypothetical protein VHZ97_05755 [Pseudonocardiaceae bacterium]|jgi:hypothetical protein|nr:hypothetical protein [Pseudonocardiaceae bacterium]